MEANLPEQISDLARSADRLLGPYGVVNIFA
jgi:hypothetical protein